MAFNSPYTYIHGEPHHARMGNDYIRDNFNATMPAIVTTVGDMCYASAANTLARRARGSDTQLLRMTGGLPAWS